MIQGIRKAPNRASKAPICYSQGHRSGNSIQRVVEPVIRPVQITDERMGSVQTEGVSRRVPKEPTASHMRAGMRSRDTRPTTRPERDPFPPPPYRCAGGGFPQFFPANSANL